MAPTGTASEIASAEMASLIYLVIAMPLGSLFAALIMYGVHLRDRKKGIISALWYFWHIIAAFSILIFMGLAQLITYVGIPKSVTFGVQIGKLLRSTCEASMAVEGPKGWPCCLKRFIEWTRRFLSNDGSYQLDEWEPLWNGVFVFVCIVAAVFSLSILITHRGRKWEEKKRGAALDKALLA